MAYKLFNVAFSYTYETYLFLKINLFGSLQINQASENQYSRTTIYLQALIMLKIKIPPTLHIILETPTTCYCSRALMNPFEIFFSSPSPYCPINRKKRMRKKPALFYINITPSDNFFFLLFFGAVCWYHLLPLLRFISIAKKFNEFMNNKILKESVVPTSIWH